MRFNIKGDRIRIFGFVKLDREWSIYFWNWGFCSDGFKQEAEIHD